MHKLSPLRVVVVSPHLLRRVSLAALLGGYPSRVAASHQDVLDDAYGRGDVIVVDLAYLRELDVDVVLRLAGHSTVVGLRMDDRDDVPAGARTFGLRVLDGYDLGGRDLVAALEAAVGRPAQDGLHAPVVFTERESAVVRLIAAGRSNLEIAEEIYVSINTVKTYVRTAYRKMGVTRRSEAVMWVMNYGLANIADSPAQTGARVAAADSLVG